MGCSDSCIKYLLFFFNLVFSLSGLALIIVGSLLISNAQSFSSLVSEVESGLKTPQIFIIVVGVIIFFIAFLGCCGAIRENRCMLITFAILLLSIFIVQLAIGIYALTHKSDFKNHIEEGLSKEFSKITTDLNAKKLFEKIERDMECCGVKGSIDYSQIFTPIPLSCCSDKSDCRIRPNAYWTRGCAATLTDFTGKSGEILGGVAIALSIIEVLGGIFALRLASRHR